MFCFSNSTIKDAAGDPVSITTLVLYLLHNSTKRGNTQDVPSLDSINSKGVKSLTSPDAPIEARSRSRDISTPNTI